MPPAPNTCLAPRLHPGNQGQQVALFSGFLVTWRLRGLGTSWSSALGSWDCAPLHLWPKKKEGGGFKNVPSGGVDPQLCKNPKTVRIHKKEEFSKLMACQSCWPLTVTLCWVRRSRSWLSPPQWSPLYVLVLRHDLQHPLWPPKAWSSLSLC